MKFYAVIHVAKILRVDSTRVVGFIRSGKLPAMNFGTSKRNRFVIRQDALKKFIRDMEAENVKPKATTKRRRAKAVVNPFF